MGFIKVGAVLFASLLVGMANASNGIIIITIKQKIK